MAAYFPFAFNTNEEFILGRRSKRQPSCDVQRLRDEVGTDDIC